MPTLPATPPDPRALVSGFEQSVGGARRRREGVHYTPDEVACAVLDPALEALGRLPATVCDPSCGGGAFLLAVADRLRAAGVSPREVVCERLVGLEVDPLAADVARAALTAWAAAHGVRVDPSAVRIHRGDALAVPVDAWPDRPRRGFDLVVGNPPFLSQLSRRTARDASRRAMVEGRFGPMGAYADDAGLFLVLGTELLADDGVVALIQPQSLLSARDAGAVRDAVLGRAQLVGLWAHAGSPFPDAEVRVCAPVLRRRDRDRLPLRGTCEVHWHDTDGVHRHTAPVPAPGGRWGALLGAALGVPDPPPLAGAPIGTLATATAGFRDEFYALAEAMCDSIDAQTPVDVDTPRLVTVGMIDPLELRWASSPHRVGGRRVLAPRVDRAALERSSPRAARWVQERLRPKVLVATQSKVVEAVADPDGTMVPMTPTISVEPTDTRLGVWHLAAALSAPPVAAWAIREHLGAGRSAGTLRWSARAVLDTSLPVDRPRWDRGASIAQQAQGLPPGDERREGLLDDLGRVMTAAYGVPPDHPVVEWWSMRRPRR